VQAFDDYLANSDKRFDRRYRRYGKETFFDRFAIPLGYARRAYCQAAFACADPFHEHLATLLERSLSPYMVWMPTDGPAVRILKNWLREEPRIETQPAEGWVAPTSVIVQFARERPTKSYAATLSLEVKQSLPELAALCVDVGTDVSIASVSLVLEREASSKSVDLLWKESRIWVIVEDSRLREGDRIDITLTSARPITQSTRVRIGKAARMASVAH
jgi:hypothetical protein